MSQNKCKNAVCQQCVEIPNGKLCGYNCADGCIYWNPYDKNDRGEQWCNWYNSYYFPRNRQGCMSFKK